MRGRWDGESGAVNSGPSFDDQMERLVRGADRDAPAPAEAWGILFDPVAEDHSALFIRQLTGDRAYLLDGQRAAFEGRLVGLLLQRLEGRGLQPRSSSLDGARLVSRTTVTAMPISARPESAASTTSR